MLVKKFMVSVLFLYEWKDRLQWSKCIICWALKSRSCHSFFQWSPYINIKRATEKKMRGVESQEEQLRKKEKKMRKEKKGNESGKGRAHSIYCSFFILGTFIYYYSTWEDLFFWLYYLLSHLPGQNRRKNTMPTRKSLTYRESQEKIGTGIWNWCITFI